MKYRATKRSNRSKLKDKPGIASEEAKIKVDRRKLRLYKTGAYVIASISAFFIITNFILKAAGVSDIAWNWELLFLVVDSVVVICLLQGLFYEKAALLQPFVVLSIVTISFLILLTLFFSTAAWDVHSYAGEYVEMALRGRSQEFAELLSVNERNVIPLIASFTVFGLAVSVAINIWFLIVIVQCAKYLRDLEPLKRSFMNGYSAEPLTDPTFFTQRTTMVTKTNSV
ncbi:hypothetical protein Tcan_09919 [Toxocara canis]|uniref:Transmembrane protein n=1 Tax=Toxocara canis TaxID=6265 RepID=A0A0B2UZ98_TOXCA|nr:hypothetical protein Tcan_09919 [Toxocara canis]